jgi:hypothetical protein
MPAPVTTPIRSTIALLIALLLTLPLGPPAAAQDFETTAGKLDIEELEGIQQAVSRSYAVDISDFVEAASSATPQSASIEGPLLMMALVAEFDSPEHAAEAVTTVRDRLLEQPTEGTGIELEATETGDLGETAFEITGISGSRASIGGYIVHEGVLLHLALAISENGSSTDAARALVEFTLSHRGNAEEVIYDHRGTSRGGIWAKFPGANDNAALSGTQPIFDSLLLPPPGDEDAQN